MKNVVKMGGRATGKTVASMPKEAQEMYAAMIEQESGAYIVHCASGIKGLGDCSAYAQRLEETEQGKATVGIFKPLSKLEIKDLLK